MIKSTYATCHFLHTWFFFFFIMKKGKWQIGKGLKRFSLGGRSLEEKATFGELEYSLCGLEEWGFGYQKLVYSNEALLKKGHWRFVIKKNCLWKHVILVKYGEQEGGCCFRGVREWKFGRRLRVSGRPSRVKST